MRRLFAMMAVAAMALSASARPAHSQAVVTPQPDGTQVTLQLCGDEFYHFSTTTDGYTVMQNAAGYWVYAQRDGERLRASSVVAHDAGNRSAAELALLASTPRRITDHAAVGASQRNRARAQYAPAKAPFDYSKFKGLIVLVQPSDITFSMGDDAQRFYNTVVNQENMTNVGFGNYGDWTGSVRDYFYDNTMGAFNPHFDIVGPIKVSYKSTQIGSNYIYAFQTALRLADSQVDYKKYDTDGDGYVDMVYFLVAGNTAAYQGNNQGYLWPHASSGVGNGTFDGKQISRYACSTEMNGPESYAFIDGIGTICHEFTHVLGLPDLYDTDYDGTNGEAHHPGAWDIMAGGTDLNYGRTPAGYSIFELYSLGFAHPQLLNSLGEGDYTLNNLAVSNEGYILRTPVNKEYFILENRQNTSKWDAYLPGHGLLVTRVDSTNAYYWTANKVNNDPERMYYELLRAGNSTTGAQSSDPFPGTFGIPSLTNTTTPSLKTFSGKENTYSLVNITESNGVISFTLKKAGQDKTIVETFNTLTESTENIYESQGDIALWRLAQCKSVAVDGNNRAVEMKNPSVLQMQEPIYYNIEQVTFDIANTSSTTAKIVLQYTTDGKNWTAAKTSTGASSLSVPGNANFTSYWKVELTNTQPAQFRIQMTGGSKTAPCRVDNFTVFYNGETGTGEDYPVGDVNGDGNVDVDDVNLIINIILDRDSADKYGNRAYITGGTSVSVDDLNALINLLLK